MPGGDRTGPDGMGPMTGRGAGFCAGFNAPGYANPAPGAAFGGRGGGFGGRGGGRRGFRRRNVYYATGMPGWMRYNNPAGFAPAPQAAADEKDVLKNQAAALQSQLDAVTERLEALEKSGDAGKEE